MTTKLFEDFSEKALMKHLLKKTLPEDLAFFLKSFCAKDGIFSSKTVGGDRFLVSKNKLGRYHDQVSTNMTKFPKAYKICHRSDEVSRIVKRHINMYYHAKFLASNLKMK